MRNILEKTAWTLWLVMTAITSVAMLFMPDTVPLHYDINGDVDRWGSKYECFLTVGAVLILLIIFRIAIRSMKKKSLTAPEEKDRAHAEVNIKVTGWVEIISMAFLTIIQCVILYSSYNCAETGTTHMTMALDKIGIMLYGVILIVIGNLMTKVKRNKIIGIRMKWSMYNDTTWRKSNRFGAYCMIVMGVLCIICAAFLSMEPLIIVVLGVVLVTLVIICIYSKKVYEKEIKK